MVTEYHFHDRDNFVIQIDYFSIQQLKLQFEELLQAYRSFHLGRAGTTREERDEREELKKRADLAKHTFKASFGSRFSEDDGMLLTRSFTDMIGIMVRWAEEMLPRQQEDRGLATEFESFNSANECSTRLGALTSEVETGRGQSLWPFIRKLRLIMSPLNLIA